MLLVGKPPFSGKDNDAIFKATARGKPNYSTGAWSDISAEGRLFVKELLTLNPTLRPSAA